MQNRENVKYTLLIFFIHGEAAAPHLCDLADDEEAVRVDGVDQLFQAGQRFLIQFLRMLDIIR